MTDLLLAALDHVSGMPVLKSIYVIQSDYAFYFWQGAYQNLKKKIIINLKKDNSCNHVVMSIKCQI